MENSEQEKPKLTYEQVQKIIQDRIILMDAKMANTSAKVPYKKKKNSLWRRIRRYFGV
jgi:hypothetical protein